MNKVTFTFKGGRARDLSERDARLLQRLGKGTYMTRDMVAMAPIQPDPARLVQSTVRADTALPQVSDLNALNLEGLRALAKDRGVKVHHNAGVEKVRAALREATE